MAANASSSVTVPTPSPGQVRVALGQSAPALGRVAENLAAQRAWLAEARQAGAQLTVFPELSLTGYYLRDIVPDVALPADDPLVRELALAAGPMAAVIGLVERGPQDACYNSAAWLQDGQVRHVHRKVYLPTYGLFDERRYFAAGHRIRAFDAPGLGRVGLAVCEDFWHVSVASVYQAEQIDWLVCIANSPARGIARPEVGTADTYLHVARTYATLLGAVVIVVNRAGVEEGLNFWGGSLIVGPAGDVLGQAPAFDAGLVFVDVDLAELRRQRLMTPLGRDARLEVTLAELQRIYQRRYADES